MEMVPKDAEPISEEQFERLPDYVVNLMADSLSGKLQVTTRDDLLAVSEQYFNQQVVQEDQILAGKREISLVSNSPLDGEMSMEGNEA
jgi:hypothetical protein